MSAITPYQPSLPPEEDFTDAEIAFLEDSPPGLFPENQDSNFGLIIRKIFSDRIQELIGQQQILYNEHFVETALAYLDMWEADYGLPPNPVGRSVPQRRQDVLNRVRFGLFTRARRQAIVESFVIATFGDSTPIDSGGIALTAAGVTLFSGITNLTGAYTITEDIPNFHYSIVVLNTIAVDLVGLTRELTRITPAGISFSVSVTGATHSYYGVGKYGVDTYG
jgi:hypothetical protein